MLFNILFWSSLALVFYAYFGYPLVLVLLHFIKNHPIRKSDITPAVSFIITAYNEEKRIRGKIENTLLLRYPEDKLEILIASDCSTDKTDEIVRSFPSGRLKLVRMPERKGKEAAQQNAIQSSGGEILIFSDVATVLQPDAVAGIVRNFSDPTVGCVSSIDRFIDKDGTVSGEGAYVKYEMLLRRLETKVNSLVGLSGSFFAARREVCAAWATDLPSDFNTVMNSVKKGLRGVLDEQTSGFYANITDAKKEFQRKVRTVLRGISVFMKNLSLLNFFRYGLFSWQLFSHKLCRWLVPYALILLFIATMVLAADSPAYRIVLAAQIVFYAVACIGFFLNTADTITAVRIPHFFLLVNLSILQAWLRFFKGEQIVTWTPSQR